MIKYVAYCNTNGDIVRMAFGKASNNPAEGLDSESGQTIVHITEELPVSRDEFVRTRYWNGTAWTTRTDRPNKVATWNGTAWTWSSSDFLDLVRNERQFKLLESDWAVLPDSPLSDSEITAVKTYRTALRNFTTTTMPTSGLMSDLTWPTKPACLG